MTTPDQAAVPSIGACLRDRQLFLVTDSGSACVVCGRPPDLTLPFGRVVYTDADAELKPIEPPEESFQPNVYDVTCPRCALVFMFDTAGAVKVAAPPTPLLPVDEAGSDSDPSPEPASPPAPEPEPVSDTEDASPPYQGPATRVDEILTPGEPAG